MEIVGIAVIFYKNSKILQVDFFLQICSTNFPVEMAIIAGNKGKFLREPCAFSERFVVLNP
jgi:hypothetical protein